MSWIRTIPYEKAEGRLKSIYDRIVGPNGYIDNILILHSLRPHTLQGHMRLYKSVLHHSGNTLEKSLLETIGVYVSMLNRCAYCVEHHFNGLRRLLDDDSRAYGIHDALGAEDFDSVFSDQEKSVLLYVRVLTLTPRDTTEEHVQALRNAGMTDAQVLEVNQVSAYFAYANRTVLGLGCSTEGDVLGLSPGDNDEEENWHHG